jgi:SRSO17 transposase
MSSRCNTFLANTPWDPVPVRQRLAVRMHKVIGPSAWVIDDTGFVKDGRMEPAKNRPATGCAPLPKSTSQACLVQAAKQRWRVEHDYRELKTGLGLEHYEGREWAGWHHHVTLEAAAHGFLIWLRHRPKAAVPERPLRRNPTHPNLPGLHHRYLPHLRHPIPPALPQR